MSQASVEVRRCSKCQQPAVLLDTQWAHTVFGASTNESTKEYRCQDCGARFVKKARSREIAFWILGVVFTFTTVVFGLPFLFVAWRQRTFDRRVPVVPGAIVPPVRYTDAPPVRTHGACGGKARVKSITKHTHHGVSTGTEYVYACEACKGEFVLDSLWGHIFSLFATTVLVGIAAAFFAYSESLGWRYGGSGVSLLLGAALQVQNGLRAYNRVRFPA